MNLASLEKVAELLGGEVRGDQVYAPGPGHTVSDRLISEARSTPHRMVS